MILVFGGTTEGRMAAQVLDEAGSRYLYSTHGHGQDVELVHGTRLAGALQPLDMEAVCREHDIRLLVDASHPFAQQLHHNVLQLARQLQLPVIRYDRIYAERDPRLVWCHDYAHAVTQLESHGITRLLALTGVNTIAALRDFWQRHECWFRILQRPESRLKALKAGFPAEHLVYYEQHDTAELLTRLQPQAIITKESGSSGGFAEKVAAAQSAGVQVFVVERPNYPTGDAHVEHVDGPHGLRRMVERLLPEFYPLHSGLTTGTCATAAAIAATRRLTTGETPATVPVVLPDGETIWVAVTYGEGYASVIKDAGDDPDVTDGLEIRARVEWSDELEICGGEGVGRFTLPGFDYPPGEPAINRTPRAMIRTNIAQPVRITISVPQGRDTARRTFNPRLGIEGGISIIGESGIVKPYSEEAFVQSIGKCMQVAQASGAHRVVINSGAKSEQYLKALYPDLPQQAFVQYGNYVGQTLQFANRLGIGRVTLGVMLGKAVKLAAGNLDTHSRVATMDRDFVSRLLAEAGCTVDLTGITLARELWDKIPAHRIAAFARVVIDHCQEHCAPLLPHSTLTIVLLDNDGHVYPGTEA
ncbi:MAG: cobalamin biosynthesis protein CbiD [Muribaculaceae bacterium]|nr:cobalamin biosynthesis protein CbiD [Muribaculaceae bacterium]